MNLSQLLCATSFIIGLMGGVDPSSTTAVSAAQACSMDILEQIKANSGVIGSQISLHCSVTLPKGLVIRGNVIFEGSRASGAVLDCGGSVIDATAGRTRMQRTAIIVRSVQRDDGSWDAPKGVTVRNCIIKGLMRVYGLDENANGPNMKRSSRDPGHTEFVQASAPKRTTFEYLTILAPGGAALYVGPGVTWTTLANSRLGGETGGTALYLDAESGRNSIRNNVFRIKTNGREIIAIDGSTRNEIVGNVFENPVNGGVFVYRNCGEGGVIRHQAPNFNVISNNTFLYADSSKPKPAVWLNSRNGHQKYCFTDPRHMFGSSASPLDFSQRNTVEMNRIVGSSFSLIQNNDETNLIQGNTNTAQ